MVKVSFKIYVITFLITFLILGMGIYSGLFLSQEKIKFLEEELLKIKISQEDTNFQFILLNEFPNQSCTLLTQNFYKLQTEASELGEKVKYYEKVEKFKSSTFKTLKKSYTLTLLRYWYLTKRLKEECNQSYVIILYFYSNFNCPDCMKQGAALLYLKEKYKEKVMIFAIDLGLEDELGSVKLLKLGYNITTVPSLVINDKKYEGFVNADELERIYSTFIHSYSTSTFS